MIMQKIKMYPFSMIKESLKINLRKELILVLSSTITIISCLLKNTSMIQYFKLQQIT